MDGSHRGEVLAAIEAGPRVGRAGMSAPKHNGASAPAERAAGLCCDRGASRAGRGTLRTLRHGTASALIAADEHIKVVQEMLGLSDDVVPGSNAVRFLIFSAAILLPAATVIIATKGRLGRAKAAVDIHARVSDTNSLKVSGDRPILCANPVHFRRSLLTRERRTLQARLTTDVWALGLARPASR